MRKREKYSFLSSNTDVLLSSKPDSSHTVDAVEQRRLMCAIHSQLCFLKSIRQHWRVLPFPAFFFLSPLVALSQSSEKLLQSMTKVSFKVYKVFKIRWWVFSPTNTRITYCFPPLFGKAISVSTILPSFGNGRPRKATCRSGVLLNYQDSSYSYENSLWNTGLVLALIFNGKTTAFAKKITQKNTNEVTVYKGKAVPRQLLHRKFRQNHPALSTCRHSIWYQADGGSIRCLLHTYIWYNK